MSNIVDVGLVESFKDSVLALDSPTFSFSQFRDWFRAERKARQMLVQEIPFARLDQWYFTQGECKLAHRSGKFFSVEGVRVETDFGPIPIWEQPIINQPEIGILGIITKMFDGVRHFLLQTKVEPGNINGIQLSPTEQATRSNYTRVHGGKLPPYHEYFIEPGRAKVLVDRLQGEQGSRFLRKRNRNIIIEVEEDLCLLEGFCWLTFGQIKRLLRQDNLVNMDTRSVLSCIPLGATGLSPKKPLKSPNSITEDLLESFSNISSAVHTQNELLNWLTGLKTRYQMELERRSLIDLDSWEVSDSEIRHNTGQYFSVIAVKVEAVSAGREVISWSQPLLKHSGYGLNGFLMQKINSVMHFLVRACVYPGNIKLFELGSTVSRSNAEDHFNKPSAPPFLNIFNNPPQNWIRYEAIQSEEGGRFYHYQNRYMILELPEDTRLDIPENYRWMTLSQIQDFVHYGYFNIEGRNLLACLSLFDYSGIEDEKI